MVVVRRAVCSEVAVAFFHAVEAGQDTLQVTVATHHALPLDTALGSRNPVRTLPPLGPRVLLVLFMTL